MLIINMNTNRQSSNDMNNNIIKTCKHAQMYCLVSLVIAISATICERFTCINYYNILLYIFIMKNNTVIRKCILDYGKKSFTLHCLQSLSPSLSSYSSYFPAYSRQPSIFSPHFNSRFFFHASAP